MDEYEKVNKQSKLIGQDLGPKCRKDIARAAGMAVVLDLHPLSIADFHKGMSHFAELIFKAGQSVPRGVNINPKFYLPLAQLLRRQFVQ